MNDYNCEKTEFLLKKIHFNYKYKEKNALNLEGFFFDTNHKNKNLHPFVKKEYKNFSLISEEKKYYVSLGKKEELTFQKLEEILKIIPLLLENYSLNIVLKTFVTKDFDQEMILRRFLHHYFFNLYKKLSFHKKEEKTKEINAFNLITDLPEKKYLQILHEVNTILKAVNYCRDLQDTPPNILNSEDYAKIIVKKYRHHKTLKCKILERKQIVNEQMNLLLSVNAGSAHEPRVVILEYFNDPESKTLTTLIGKGITFDTGGYSLKPSRYQLGMKFDMSGSAIVLSLMDAICNLNLKTNVIAIACLTDNKIGSKATLVESVIKSKSGKMVEITNTDAEGRLIVADAITYAKEKYTSKYSDQEIIELSTLTGAISIALGHTFTGAFANNDSLYERFYQSSKKQHELLWRLPVCEANHKFLDSKIADFANASKSYLFGSSNAAAFLFKFAEKTPFLHLDIAGTATNENDNRGLGVMIPTIIEFLKNKSQKNKLK